MDKKLNYQILITLKDRISKALGGVKKKFEEDIPINITGLSIASNEQYQLVKPTEGNRKNGLFAFTKNIAQ